MEAPIPASCAAGACSWKRFDKLLMRKEFDDISVQEIADEATLEPGHVLPPLPRQKRPVAGDDRARFRDLIARRGLSFTDCDGALRAIALGVCDYLAEHGLSQSGARCPWRAPLSRSSKTFSERALPIIR